MGCTFDFSCPKCGYHVSVSGGTDCGFHAVTNTILCGDCKRLYDVVTSEDPASTAFDDGWKPSAYSCPKSTRHAVELWFHPGPCPKCGTQMTKGREAMLWD